MRASKPPPDGHLFQEDWCNDPFWMIVACQLVNLTHWEKAKPVFFDLRSMSGYHELGLALADPVQLYDLFRPIGLWRKRAITLPKFAKAWMRDTPKTAEDLAKLPGCGKYACDSWAIFIDGRLDVEPTDGKLNWYMEQQNVTSRIAS